MMFLSGRIVHIILALSVVLTLMLILFLTVMLCLLVLLGKVLLLEVQRRGIDRTGDIWGA